MKKPVVYGVLASLILLSIYFVLTSTISGLTFAIFQFKKFWYFTVALAVGFGIQVGLFYYIRQIHKKMSAGIVAATGTTSTLSMISCCAHYLINLLPVLGATGIVSLISGYQVQLFWVGLVFNLLGILYMSGKVYKLETI